jgi:hypothetical protein
MPLLIIAFSVENRAVSLFPIGGRGLTAQRQWKSARWQIAPRCWGLEATLAVVTAVDSSTVSWR